MGKLGNERGKRSEDLVDQALATLKDNGEIRGFVHFSPYSREDLRGMDFRVRLIDGRALPLQVKSSDSGAAYHKKKGGNIPVLIVRSGDTIESISQDLRKLCRR